MDNLGQNNTNTPNQPQSPAGTPPTPPTPGAPTVPGAMPGTTPGVPGAATGPMSAGPAPHPMPPLSNPPRPGAVPPAAGMPPRPGAPAPGMPPRPGASAPGAAPVPGAPGTPGVPGAPGTAPAQPGAKPASPDAKKKKMMYIVLGVVAGLLVIGCIVAAVIAFMPKEKSDPNPAPAPVAVEPESTEKTPLEDMDAEGLLAAFDEMQSADYTLENYLPEELQPYAHGYTLALTDSYSKKSELENYDLYGSSYESNYEISADGSFAVFTALEDGEVTSSQPVYIAFNSAYLEYTIGNSGTGVLGEPIPDLAFVDISEEFVEKALPIINLTYGATPINMTYDFHFNTEEEGYITMTTDLIGVSYTMDSSSATTVDSNGEPASAAAAAGIEYLVQGAITEVTVDLETGEVTYADYDGQRQNIVAEFPIEEADFEERYTSMTGTAGHESSDE